MVGVLLVLTPTLAALFWFVFVPNWRPPLGDGERYGVDVSNHQRAIDRDQVASHNIDFAYIKATEGGTSPTSFLENWTASEAAGLDRGAYHFFTLCRARDEQARHFLDVAAPDRRALRSMGSLTWTESPVTSTSTSCVEFDEIEVASERTFG